MSYLLHLFIIMRSKKILTAEPQTPNLHQGLQKRFSRTRRTILSQSKHPKTQVSISNQISKRQIKIQYLTKRIQILTKQNEQLLKLNKINQDKYLSQFHNSRLFQEEIQRSIIKINTLQRTIEDMIKQITKLLKKISVKDENLKYWHQQEVYDILQLQANPFHQSFDEIKYSNTHLIFKLIKQLQFKVGILSESNTKIPQLHLQIQKQKWQNKLRIIELQAINKQFQKLKQQCIKQRSKSRQSDKTKTQSYRYSYGKNKNIEQLNDKIQNTQNNEKTNGGFKKIRRNIELQRNILDQEHKTYQSLSYKSLNTEFSHNGNK